ncbi:hypothetical protein B0H10DRAFT_1721358, partial [Mycena sp. CBHHK59/15]
LVSTLRMAKDNGFQSESGWKPQVWALCITALKDSPGPSKTASKIQDHFGTVKKPFPLYDDLAYLVKGIVATGAGAFHAGMTQTQAESSTSTSQTQPNSEKQTQMQSDRGSQEPVTPPRGRSGGSRFEVCPQLEEDDDFSEDEGANIMMLFTESAAVAQTFLAATSKPRCTAFLQNCLRKAK